MDLPFLPNDENQCGFHIEPEGKGTTTLTATSKRSRSTRMWYLHRIEHIYAARCYELLVPPTVSVGGSTMLLQQQIYMPFADQSRPPLTSPCPLLAAVTLIPLPQTPPCILNTKSPSENINGVCWVYFCPSGQYHIGPESVQA